MAANLTRIWRGLIHAVRVLLGSAYAFFGANFYLHLIDMGAARNPHFVTMMTDSGYLHLVKGAQLLGGLLLLTAVTVSIIAFHLTMYRAEYDVAIAFGACNLLLPWAYRHEFVPLLRLRARPS